MNNDILVELATVTLLEWVGIAFLIVGEWMMCAKSMERRSWRFWAFAMYVPWDFIFAYSAVKLHSMAFLGGQLFFIIMTARGMWNNRPVSRG